MLFFFWTNVFGKLYTYWPSWFAPLWIISSQHRLIFLKESLSPSSEFIKRSLYNKCSYISCFSSVLLFVQLTVCLLVLFVVSLAIQRFLKFLNSQKCIFFCFTVSTVLGVGRRSLLPLDFICKLLNYFTHYLLLILYF